MQYSISRTIILSVIFIYTLISISSCVESNIVKPSNNTQSNRSSISIRALSDDSIRKTLRSTGLLEAFRLGEVYKNDDIRLFLYPKVDRKPGKLVSNKTLLVKLNKKIVTTLSTKLHINPDKIKIYIEMGECQLLLNNNKGVYSYHKKCERAIAEYSEPQATLTNMLKNIIACHTSNDCTQSRAKGTRETSISKEIIQKFCLKTLEKYRSVECNVRQKGDDKFIYYLDDIKVRGYVTGTEQYQEKISIMIKVDPSLQGSKADILLSGGYAAKLVEAKVFPEKLCKDFSTNCKKEEERLASKFVEFMESINNKSGDRS